MRRAGLLTQMLGLWIRALIYLYPFNVIAWVGYIIIIIDIIIMIIIIIIIDVIIMIIIRCGWCWWRGLSPWRWVGCLWG